MIVLSQDGLLTFVFEQESIIGTFVNLKNVEQGLLVTSKGDIVATLDDKNDVARILDCMMDEYVSGKKVFKINEWKINEWIVDNE